MSGTSAIRDTLCLVQQSDDACPAGNGAEMQYCVRISFKIICFRTLSGENYLVFIPNRNFLRHLRRTWSGQQMPTDVCPFLCAHIVCKLDRLSLHKRINLHCSRLPVSSLSSAATQARRPFFFFSKKLK